MESTIGCFQNLTSGLTGCNHLKNTMHITPKSSGSVGKLRPTLNCLSVKVIDKGVAKTINSMSLSSEKNAKPNTAIATGMAKTQYCSKPIPAAKTTKKAVTTPKSHLFFKASVNLFDLKF